MTDNLNFSLNITNITYSIYMDNHFTDVCNYISYEDAVQNYYHISPLNGPYLHYCPLQTSRFFCPLHLMFVQQSTPKFSKIPINWPWVLWRWNTVLALFTIEEYNFFVPLALSLNNIIQIVSNKLQPSTQYCMPKVSYCHWAATFYTIQKLW